jgi:caa(3)-type oxidase subunit IV
MTRNKQPASLPTYICLAALTAASIGFVYLPLNPWRVILVLLFALVQGLLMIVDYMRVRLQDSLIWIAAGFSFFWLAILFSLCLSDYLTRRATW